MAYYIDSIVKVFQDGVEVGELLFDNYYPISGETIIPFDEYVIRRLGITERNNKYVMVFTVSVTNDGENHNIYGLYNIDNLNSNIISRYNEFIYCKYNSEDKKTYITNRIYIPLI